jgi:putative solute:sodium symporter small subunit
VSDDLYWRRTRRLTFRVIAVWLVVTFGLAWFSDELNRFSFLGFPLGFYMAAQGSLLVYLAMIAFYNSRMRKLEEESGIED